MILSRSATVPALQREPVAAIETGFLHEVGAFFRQFVVAAFDSYHPERHYMRGPGPACRASMRSQGVPDAA